MSSSSSYKAMTMEYEDWLRRGILVSNLPTSDDVTTDKLEIHFSKRSNGGGDVEDIIMLDNFMAIVKFKEERTVESVLAKRSQYLLGSILTVTRYTKSDMEFLKASNINSSTNPPINCNGYDEFYNSDTDVTDDDAVDKCSSYEFMQIFTNISASLPFSKLEPGLFESRKQNTLKRIAVNTGVKLDVDNVKQLLILSGSFDEVRQAAKKLQHYTMSEDTAPVVDKPDVMSTTLRAARMPHRQRSPRPDEMSTTLEAERIPHMPYRQRSPRPSPPESPVRKIQKTEFIEQSNQRNQIPMNQGRLGLNSTKESPTDQNNMPTLKLRPMSQIDGRKKEPKQRIEKPENSNDDFTNNKTNRYMRAPDNAHSNNEVKSSTVQDVKESAKPKNTAKVDVSSLDPKLCRYLFSVLKSDIETIERRHDVKFLTTEKGQVSVEVNKDAMEWQSNLKSSIAEFHKILGKVREQDPDVEIFGLGDLNLSSNDFEDIYDRVCHNNSEVFVELLEKHACIQVYGPSAAIEKVEEWFEQEVFTVYRNPSNKEESFQDDLERDGSNSEVEDEDETENDSGEEEEQEDEDYVDEDYNGESEDDTHGVRKGISQITLDTDIQEQSNRDRDWTFMPTGGNHAEDKKKVMAETAFAQISSQTSRTQQSSHDLIAITHPTPTLRRVVDKQFDQIALNYIQTFHFEDINKLRSKYGVDFEMRNNGIVQVRQRNSLDDSNLKINKAVAELTALVNDVQGIIHTDTLDIRKFSDVDVKITNLAIRTLKDNNTVLVEDGPGCKVKVYGTRPNVQDAVDDFLRKIKSGKVDGKPKTEDETVGSQQRNEPLANPGLSHFPSTCSQNVPATQQYRVQPSLATTRIGDTSAAADDLDFQAARRTSNGSDDSISAVSFAEDKKDVMAETIFAQNPRPTSHKQQCSGDLISTTQPIATSQRVVDKQFDKTALDYIQNFHFEDINKLRNKYGVDFEMRDSGIVQVRQRNSSRDSSLNLNKAMDRLATLVNDVQEIIHTDILDIRKFPDVNVKIVNIAIRMLKNNKKVLVEDGPGCKVKVHGTKANVKAAIDAFLQILKTGKVDEKPQTGDKPGKVPLTKSSMSKSPSTFRENRVQPRLATTLTSDDSAVADEIDLQTASHANNGLFDYDESWPTNEQFSTLSESVNSRIFESMQSDAGGIDYMPVEKSTNYDDGEYTPGNALLADPRNYLELNEEAGKLVTAPSNTNSRDEQDGFNDHMNWYEGDLQSVVTKRNTSQGASIKPSRTDAAQFVQSEYVGGATGGIDYDDSGDDHSSPDVGLMDDIANYGDLDDEVPASATSSLQTSAGFDIEIQSGNITLEFVSVIVTSADPHLRPNTGASRAIQKAGGVELVKECQNWVRLRGPVDASKPVYTSGGNLTCSQVLHVVPPDQGSQALGTNPLIDMMQSVMTICTHPLKATSIALPAVGIDALQMRKNTYAKYLFDAVLDCIKTFTQHGTTIKKLRIVDKNPSVVETLQTVFISMSTDLRNKQYFQPGAQPAFAVMPVSPFGAQRGRNTGAKPKRQNYRRRNRSFNSNRNRTSNSKNMFQSERLTRSTTATTYDDDDDEDFGSSNPFTTSTSDNDTGDTTCPVCLDTIDQPKTLSCKHTFCRNCLDQSVKHAGQLCPVCKQPFGKGRRARTMPPGNMDVKYDNTTRVPGYPDANGVIIITYSFTSGMQNRFHPNPGSVYQGTTRTAYLPDNPEGQDVLSLLKRAFDSKLTFTIGTSSSTGEQNVIVWNDIHHKTSITGGPQNHGYPDPRYLARVRQELEDKGIR